MGGIFTIFTTNKKLGKQTAKVNPSYVNTEDSANLIGEFTKVIYGPKSVHKK